jgi:hypothetical protein
MGHGALLWEILHYNAVSSCPVGYCNCLLVHLGKAVKPYTYRQCPALNSNELETIISLYIYL